MEALCRANEAYVEALHREVRVQADQRAACERAFAEASSRAAGAVDGLEDALQRLLLHVADAGRGDRAALAEAQWRLGEQEAFVARAEAECGARVAAIAGLHEEKRRLAAELRDMREELRAARASREAVCGELEDARELVAELREREVWLQARIADLESSAGLPRACARCARGGASSPQYSPTSPPPVPDGVICLDASPSPSGELCSPASVAPSASGGAARSASPSPLAAGAKRRREAPVGRRRGWTQQPPV